MISRKYNLVNNIGGWLVFVIALVTYWLTLEPTASYWDCGEFIIQADKLEVGHPPGNPIFMLTARFFANFAGSDSSSVALMVNAMSGLLSALTILLLFWTISHLVRRLVVRDGQRSELSLQQYLVIFGSAAVGSLAYCWSDTFWFSAVEGEVYAFSSFCTALVFWLILKWENRADDPHSDKYLILIAYIIGVSVAVHLLNLLCIPAIVLVFAYRKFKDMNLVKSLIALLVSFAIIVLVLYGLVPGFIKTAQKFELLFVNDFGMSFNSGALVYAILTAAVIVWSLFELYRQKSEWGIKASFFIAIVLSGMLFIGPWWIGSILVVALLAALYFSRRIFCNGLPVRVLSVIMWSVGVIFVGYSSYALILIRSNADTPMNQNSPDNVFDLGSYLNREQYGETPLLYGQTLNSGPMKKQTSARIDTITTTEDGTPITLMTPDYTSINEKGKPLYTKGVAGAQPSSALGFLSDSDIARNTSLSQSRKDYYVKKDYEPETKMNPELNMLFPRLYASQFKKEYSNWVNFDTLPGNLVTLSAVDSESGEKVIELDTQSEPTFNEATGTVSYPVKTAYKPTFWQNLSYFINYQVSHMYMRYFMWNFAGRQNDLLNQGGELDAGNWISGIPIIDNPRLGNQSLLPEPLGKGNKAHNVYYMLPLILGIIGLLWQAFAGKRGIEQFWVVFFLFFMTGLAIVLYLNQTPSQPRERDYSFAGSFYAYAIWIGMGVAALWRIFAWIAGYPARKRKNAVKSPENDKKHDAGSAEEVQLASLTDEPRKNWRISQFAAAIACIVGIVVPIQMVSQTWDDHDRSGRYAARDFAINYLESLEPNAIVFCNGDNDTFPLWYVQEVEGVRPDVKIINLSYLASDWYANQQRMQSYSAPPVDFIAKPEDYAYGKIEVAMLDTRVRTPMDLSLALKTLYSGKSKIDGYPYPVFPTCVVTVPVDKEAVVKRGLIAAADTAKLADKIVIDLANTSAFMAQGYLSMSNILMLDIIANNAAKGWPRPIYWCSTVGNDSYLGLEPYMQSTGMTYQLMPYAAEQPLKTRTDRAFDVITKRYRWGGLDVAGKKSLYFDETAGRMLSSVRTSITSLATELIYEGDRAKESGDNAKAVADYRKALQALNLLETKVPEGSYNYGFNVAQTYAEALCELGSKERLNQPQLVKRGLKLLETLMERYAPYLTYSRAMNQRFGRSAFSLETTYAPYQYYTLIELYERMGGKKATVKKILDRYGLQESIVKSDYDAYLKAFSGGGSGTSGESGLSLEDIETEIAKYAEIVVHLQSLSPAEYANTSLDERHIDSLFTEAIELFVSEGGDIKKLEAYDNFKKVDMARSKKVAQQYKNAHPEQMN